MVSTLTIQVASLFARISISAPLWRVPSHMAPTWARPMGSTGGGAGGVGEPRERLQVPLPQSPLREWLHSSSGRISSRAAQEASAVLVSSG